MLRLAPSCVLLALLTCGCSSNRLEPSAEAQDAIVGGTLDEGDPAVVMVYTVRDDGTGTVCTGTVVSPHVIVTAAHCVDPETLRSKLGTDKYRFSIFLGADNNDPAQYNDTANFVSVASTSFDPGYHLKDSPPVHDVGAIVTKTALTVSPVPINRTALGQEAIGTPARVVGYGRSIATSDASSGARRQATVSLATVTPETLTFGPGALGTCEGDSGGPLFIQRNGVESLAGIHSYGDSATCKGTSFDMRADVDLVPFIEPIVAMNDTGFQLPDDGSSMGSGGADGGGGDGGGDGSSAGAGGANGSAQPATTDSGCSVSAGQSQPSGPYAALLLLIGAWIARGNTSRARRASERNAQSTSSRC